MRPALQAWTMHMVPKELGGTKVGLMFGSQALFAAVSLAVGGLLADAFGPMAAFYFVAATILAANIVVVLVPERLVAVTEAEPAATAVAGAT